MMTHHWHWGIGKLCWPRESTSGDEKHLVGKGGRAIAKNWRASTKDHFHHSRTHYNKHSQPQQQEATCRPLRPGKTSKCIWIEHLSSKQSRDLQSAHASDLRPFCPGWCWGWGRSPCPRERSLDLLLCLCDCHLRPPSRSPGCQVFQSLYFLHLCVFDSNEGIFLTHPLWAVQRKTPSKIILAGPFIMAITHQNFLFML